MPIRAGESFGSHWVRSGLPFIGFMVMGSVGISVLLQVRLATTTAARTRCSSHQPGSARRCLLLDLQSGCFAGLAQGRNDVRDAASDVTDLRAPARQQRVRKKNRSFSMEGENEVSEAKRRPRFHTALGGHLHARRPFALPIRPLTHRTATDANPSLLRPPRFGHAHRRAR